MPHNAAAEGRGLLRVLLLRHGSLPAGTECAEVLRAESAFQLADVGKGQVRVEPPRR